MQTDRIYAVMLIIVMALVTYMTRSLPMVLVRKKIRNRFVLSFLYYMPTAVLASMTFPALLYVTDSILAGVLGMICAVFLSLKKRSLITVALLASLVVLCVISADMFII